MQTAPSPVYYRNTEKKVLMMMTFNLDTIQAQPKYTYSRLYEFEKLVDAYFNNLGKEIHNIQRLTVDCRIAENLDFTIPKFNSE